jgi:hypothetical protein
MRRPNLSTRLFGHPIILVSVLLIGGWLIYEWWRGNADILVAIGAGLAITTCANAHQRRDDYLNWKRAWDAMGGDAPPPRVRRPRPIVGLILWLLIGVALFSLVKPNDQTTQLALIGYGLVGVVLIARTFQLYWRQRSVAEPRRAAKAQPVSIALPIPKQSPDTRQLFQALPDYCGRLG